MKMVSRVIILSVVIGFTSMVAQVNSNYDGPKPEVREGAKSLVFQYTPFQSNLEPVYVAVSTVNLFNENFESADLFGAGFRYFVTDQTALGIGLSFGTITSTTEDDIAKTESSTIFFGIGIDANYPGNTATVALQADGSLLQWDGGAGPRRLRMP